MNDNFDDEILKFLVADDEAFQRRLLAETLRATGTVRIDYAESAAGCLECVTYAQPDVLILGELNDGDALAMVRQLRQGAAGPAMRSLPVIMVGAQQSARDVEAARNAGVDEFLVRPYSTAALMARVDAVRARRREFVESVVYIGPCRRRRRPGDYEGPLRRLFDATDADADAPEVQIRKGLVRMYVERLGQMLGQADMRDLSLVAAQLNELCADMSDKLLMSAGSSLFNYLKGVGAQGAFNGDVVRAHLDAVLQLAELPNSQVELRQMVTQQLGVMVTKKLRTAATAA